MRFAMLILFHFSYISYENEIFWSHFDQLISFSFIYKTGGGGGRVGGITFKR